MGLSSTVGADYGDGRDKQLRGTVRVCETHVDGGKSVTSCPWLNAFWDGEQMAFGGRAGHPRRDRPRAHPRRHPAHLGLSGGYASAINEGLSDVFGKFLALKAGDPNDAGPDHWLLGVGTAPGQARDTKDQANSGQGPGPDRVNGEHWVGAGGDPRIDALVVDKTDYLITDGGANGQRVRGIGEDKSIALWWKVENLLRPTSTFRDLGVALNAACVSNARTHVAGTGVADCVQVAKAVAATQLLRAP
jgi:Zn-dependent metalloprotease